MLEKYSSALQELGRAENAMRIEYDLQLDGRSTSEVLAIWLPELQETRQLARLLNLRARLAIAEQRWTDVVDDCRLGFRLADCVTNCTDFLVGRFIGFAISQTMMDVLEEAIEQPGCPSLYWALATLPEDRLFETRQATEFETVFIYRLLGPAASLPDQPIGEVAASDQFLRLFRELIKFSDNPSITDETADLMAGAYIVSQAAASRELLSGVSQWGERAKSLSASEAVLRAIAVKFARVCDRSIAWSTLPGEVGDQYRSQHSAWTTGSVTGADSIVGLVGLLIPPIHQVRMAGLKMREQRIRILNYEAIRLYAGVYGELPPSMAGLKPVPAWKNVIAVNQVGYQRLSPTAANLTSVDPRDPDSETIIQIQLREAK